MQFKSLYNLIKSDDNNKLLNDVYSEIYKLKSIFSDSIKREETLRSYCIFYEKIRSNYKISNYPALRIFVIDFFTYEMKKYQENEELFTIILDVLSENNGDAFIASKKLFNIILKKYIFEKLPENDEECKNILEKALKNGEDNKDLFLKKYNEIISTKGNENIKEIINEIVQQYFGFYFNGYFTSFYGEYVIDYYYILENNQRFFGICTA